MKLTNNLISAEAALAIIDCLKSIADKQVQIYLHGRSDNFCLGTEGFKQRYNAVKDKYGGNAREEMMELYGDHSLYKIAMAMVWLLERREYIVFARYFHVFSPPFLIALVKQMIANMPHVFDIFKGFHETQGFSIVQIFYGLALQFFVLCKYGEAKSIRLFSSDQLLAVEEMCAVEDLSSLFLEGEFSSEFGSRFRREELYIPFFRLDVFHSIERGFEDADMELISPGDLLDVELSSPGNELDNVSCEGSDDLSCVQECGEDFEMCVNHTFGQDDFYS